MVALVEIRIPLLELQLATCERRGLVERAEMIRRMLETG
jgi:hypothetical protein